MLSTFSLTGRPKTRWTLNSAALPARYETTWPGTRSASRVKFSPHSYARNGQLREDDQIGRLLRCRCAGW